MDLRENTEPCLGEQTQNQVPVLQGWLHLDRGGHLRPLLPPHLEQPGHHRGVEGDGQTVQGDGEPGVLRCETAGAGADGAVGGDDVGLLPVLPHRDREGGGSDVCHPTLDPHL